MTRDHERIARGRAAMRPTTPADLVTAAAYLAAAERPAFCTRCGWTGRAHPDALPGCPECRGYLTPAAFDGAAAYHAQLRPVAEVLAELRELCKGMPDPFCDDCGRLLLRCECPDIHPEGV